MNTRARKLKKHTKKQTKKYTKRNKYNVGGGWEKAKMRGKAIGTPLVNVGKGAISSIITMENPIVFAYQLIERKVFGWDVVEPERKMSETQRQIFGNALDKNYRKTSLKQFVKGEYYSKPKESLEEHKKKIKEEQEKKYREKEKKWIDEQKKKEKNEMENKKE
jgi:hypothetical protein